MKRIAVVILNWNGRKFLEEFLPNVIEYSIDVADIYVADNGSTDNSLEYLKLNFHQVKTIELSENFGFAKGYNLALKQIDAEYYILLNSDVQVSENWIAPVIEFLDSNKDYVACQPKLLSFYHPDTFEYAGAAGGFIDKLGYPFCKGRIFNSIEKDLGQYNEFDEIFWATGACLFVRAKEFHKLNGFDDDFFAHMEEIDLCWRFKNAGYKVGYCPNSSVLHVGGGSLPKSSSFKTYLNMRNNLTMVYKNHSSKHINWILFQRLFFDLASSLKFLFDSGIKEFWTVPRAHYYFFKHFKEIKAKRKNTAHAHVSRVYNKSIVFRYFIRQRRYFSQLNSKDFTASS
ncbi:glycosyltransferase family 2 protein [Bacteroidales bacterium OttesenSCG-928-K03]|nr:glycosyltransferase family 2 protein [Odoribacter sp. OttesenSCG-928-L07]MDL2243199.1 glycosyltransferase family 2 protein [Bacteroidales bacterium OttesenSCG-928-K03]